VQRGSRPRAAAASPAPGADPARRLLCSPAPAQLPSQRRPPPARKSVQAVPAPGRTPDNIVTVKQAGGASIVFGVEYQLTTSAASAAQKAQIENMTTIALASLAKFMTVGRLQLAAVVVRLGRCSYSADEAESWAMGM
jgi:hypothetical protein